MSAFNSKGMPPLILVLVITLVWEIFFHRHQRFLAFGNELPTDATVAQVIDGDTLILEGGEKVRYLGINAPEVTRWNGSKWIPKTQILGREAKSFNQNLVQGKRVRLEYDKKKRDKHNRLLAHVRAGEVWVNGELIRQGLALMDVRAPNLKHQEMFLRLQKEARDFHRGIWKKITDYTISDREAMKYVGELGVVCGKIVRVYLGSKKLYLNFGEDFHKDFTGIIYRENLRNFPLEDNDPIKYFLERRVKVYGSIKDIGGAAIIICAPSQMDILY